MTIVNTELAERMLLIVLELSPWLTGPATVLGILAGAYTLWEKVRTEGRTRRQEAMGVSARIEHRHIYENPDVPGAGYSHAPPDVVIRNDGPLPVTLTDLRLGLGAYANLSHELEQIDCQERPRKQPLNVHQLDRQFLTSGEEARLTLPVYVDTYDLDFSGQQWIPELDFVGHSGQLWSLCGAGVNPDQEPPVLERRPTRPSPTSLRMRRHRWIVGTTRQRQDRFSRWERQSEELVRWWTNQRRSRRRHARLAQVHDWLWGWRSGVDRQYTFPVDLPKAWRFEELIQRPAVERRNKLPPSDPTMMASQVYWANRIGDQERLRSQGAGS